MDDIKVTSIRITGPIKVFKAFVVEFCDNSSIHGVRYFTERQLHWSERLWWLFAIAVSLWMCGSLTRNIWDNWNEKPVTFSFNERKEPVAAIPFPQITICSGNKISQKHPDIIRALKFNLSDINKDHLNALIHICPWLQLEQLELKDNFTSESIFSDISGLAPSILDYGGGTFSLQLNWPFKLVPVLTEDGLCATFNALSSSEFYTDEMAPGMKIMNDLSNDVEPNWHFETPFNYSLGRSRYPVHTAMHGRDSGPVFLHQDHIAHWVYRCNGFDRGFKVVLNLPGESVKMSKKFIRVPPAEDIRIIIKPKLTYTSEELRSYSPNQRQCYFNSENQLRFFKIYSQSSCDEECLANFTKIECGCVKFNMPRDNKTRICGGAKIECYKSAAMKFKNESTKSFREKCNCLHACTTIEYQTDIERSKFTLDSVIRRSKDGTNASELGYIRIYYDSKYISTVKRIPVYTYVDFLANCGSFLGVFLGISMLSIVELIYFASLRMFWANHTPKTTGIFAAIKQKLSSLRLVRGIRWFFNELCDNSNIHGFLYFTRRNLHWSERLFWIISVGMAIWMSYSLIHNFWLQWNENPVTLSFSKSPASISTISLPTITICSDIKSLAHRLDNTFLRSLTFKLKRRSEYYRNNLMFHALFQTFTSFGTMVAAQLLAFAPNESVAIYDAIHKISPQLNETMANCWWKNKPIDCSKHFAPVFTEEGLCFSFNTLNSDDIYTDEMAPGMKSVENNPKLNNWNSENGFTSESNGNDYPMRLLDSASFKISFSINYEEIDYMYWIMGSDFKVIFTPPGEAMQFVSKFYDVPLSKHVRITLHSKKTTTSAGLRSYTPNQRQCYFESEHPLRFFKIYTQINCELECLANHLIDQFGCVKFYLPRDENTTICGLSRQKIVTTAENAFWTDGRVIEANGHESIREKCNCLPACTTIEYNADVDKSYLQIDHKKNSQRIDQAELTISFENRVEIVERLETYTITDFLAICGGLLGLFMGVSAMSIIGLIYFCTLRWFWKLRRERLNNEVDDLEPRGINVIPYEQSNC